MKLKLFKKYFFTTAGIIFFSFSVMVMILSLVLNNYISNSQYEILESSSAQTVENLSLEENGIKDKENFLRLINSLSKVSSVDIFISDQTGKILACACDEWIQNEKCSHSDFLIPVTEIEKAKNNNKHGISTLNIYQNPHYISSKQLESENGESVAFVFSTTPVSKIEYLMVTVSRLYLLSAILPIILMFFAIYAMSYRLTKPLRLMSQASKAMAKGDFSKRIPVTSDDEIGELAVSFNMMTNSLSQLEGMRRSFVANVSHELKTPMTSIGGFIDGILDGTIPYERQEYYLNIVSEEIKRLSRLVQSMLNMARLESGEFKLCPENFDYRELICAVVVGQEQRIEKQELSITGLDELHPLTIKADKDLIYQVIYNLVDNAIKFTNDKGTIDFKLKNENGAAVFVITNTGKGIPQKELPFVFERFYKVDKSRSDVKNSTGLGLYIVKTIITSHRGSITVVSKEGEFTSFKVILPLV